MTGLAGIVTGATQAIVAEHRALKGQRFAILAVAASVTFVLIAVLFMFSAFLSRA